MKANKHPLHKAIGAASKPVKFCVHGVCLVIPHNKRRGACTLGVGFILIGSWMATAEQHYVPHFLWDALSYFIHGVGSAPLVERLIGSGGDGGEGGE